ncbi:MAG: hypothetical protein PHO41_10925 [Eubacteriales bacterium]|nr:hypothetical protein [Eubacteriales bacterium]
MEAQTFAALLEWVIGGGCVVLTFWLMEHIKFLKALESDFKRYASAALAYVLAALAFGLQVAFSLHEIPPTALEWLNHAVWLGGLVFTASQLEHGVLVLRKKKAVALRG